MDTFTTIVGITGMLFGGLFGACASNLVIAHVLYKYSYEQIRTDKDFRFLIYGALIGFLGSCINVIVASIYGK